MRAIVRHWSEDDGERLFRQGCQVRYAFVAEHRGQFSIRAMWRCLRIQPSGFYAWLKAPLSKRAREDERQIALLKEAWVENGKVCGHRKLHDDLLEPGESICLNRVALLARLAGIKAQIDNTLDRQFSVATPDKAWVTEISYPQTGRFRLSRRGH